jgi:hypothetical protein
MNAEAPINPFETENTSIETTATTSSSEMAGGSQHSWSYRRFDTDQQATVAFDAWNFLQEEASPLLTEIGNRSRDFYQAEKNIRLGFAQVFPSPTPASSTDASTTATHPLPHAKVNRLNKSVTEIADSLLSKLQQLQKDDSTGSDSEAVTFQMTLHELNIMTRQLQMFLNGSRQLASYCQAVATQASQARQQSARQNEQIREFITTLWVDHSEQLRAYPPLWDLGPLDAPLYGMGRAKTHGSGPAGPPAPPSAVVHGDPSSREEGINDDLSHLKP